MMPIVASTAKRLVTYSLDTHLNFLNLATWPPQGSKDWDSFGQSFWDDLCTEWVDFLTQ